MKSYAKGRKNFLFHDTVKGASANAVVYTLAETAKVNGLNIRLYLETMMGMMLDYKMSPINPEGTEVMVRSNAAIL